VPNSTWCEHEGMLRMERLLTEENPLTIEVFVTDRNRQNAKYIRETMLGTRHYFDTWHISKSNNNLIQVSMVVVTK